MKINNNKNRDKNKQKILTNRKYKKITRKLNRNIKNKN